MMATEPHPPPPLQDGEGESRPGGWASDKFDAITLVMGRIRYMSRLLQPWLSPAWVIVQNNVKLAPTAQESEKTVALEQMPHSTIEFYQDDVVTDEIMLITL